MIKNHINIIFDLIHAILFDKQLSIFLLLIKIFNPDHLVSFTNKIINLVSIIVI